MATPPFLTDDEIMEIARPLKQPAAIARWFRANGYDVKVRPNGMPLINRANFDAASAGQNSRQGVTDKGVQPNVKAFLDKLANGAKLRPVSSKA